MEKKEATILGDLLAGITEKVEKQAQKNAEVETVLVDLTDELKTCVDQLRTMVEDGLVKLKGIHADPDATADDGYRLLGKIEGWHDASCLIVELSMRVLGRIHGKVQ